MNLQSFEEFKKACEASIHRNIPEDSSAENFLINVYKEVTSVILMNQNKEKEKPKMIVTIIGSLSCGEKIKEASDLFLEKDYFVQSPFDDNLKKMPLVLLQKEYLKRIEVSDLIVAIPKNLDYCDDPDSQNSQKECLSFGESTCYELAVAKHLRKPIVYWAS